MVLYPLYYNNMLPVIIARLAMPCTNHIQGIIYTIWLYYKQGINVYGIFHSSMRVGWSYLATPIELTLYLNHTILYVGVDQC